MVFLRHVLSILLLPTMVAVVVPRWILRAYAAADSRWPDVAARLIPRSLGVLIVMAGVVLVAWCIALFARVGRGTLAPWDPTSRLVAVGPYQYTRNPMITGVATTLVGLAVFTGSLLLAAWTAAFIAINQVYFVLVEEPGLEGRFGPAYLEYKSAVPRWIPRLHR